MAKIISWNINGVRSLPQPLPTILSSLDSDICCFQETKVTRGALDSSIAFVDGYNSYFGFSRKREGYSGVATYCKDQYAPVDAAEGLSSIYMNHDNRQANISARDQLPSCNSVINDTFDIDELKQLDVEGRAVISRHQIQILDPDSFVSNIDSSSNDRVRYLDIINVYCPRLDPERIDRKEYKQRFYRLLQLRAQQLLDSGDHVLIIGDFNCFHKRLDHCDPDADPEFDQNDSRLWMDQFLNTDQCNVDESPAFVDLFRWFHPDAVGAYTCWNTCTGARVTNFGTRIDYAIGDYGLITSNLVADIQHLTDVVGSDHCPVQVTLKNCRIIRPQAVPRACTKFMPEFSGEQQRLHQFLIKRTVNVENTEIRVKKSKPEDNGKSKKPTKTLVDYFSASLASSTNDDPVLVRSLLSQPSESATSSQSSCSNSSQSSTNSSNAEAVSKWQSLFQQPKKEAPLCRGHKEPCVLRTVKKPGPNLNRRFYTCARPIGRKDDPNARCEHFQWTK